MDDLNWTYQAHPEHVPVTVHASGETYEMSPAQSAQPQLLAVFNAVVQTSPRLGNCRVELNGAWGWAQRINTAAARHGTTKRGRRWRPTKAKS